MVAPISLPRLSAGENTMEVRCCDKHGMNTVPFSEIVDFREAADVAGWWESAKNEKIVPHVAGWKMIAAAEASMPVQVVYRFDCARGPEVRVGVHPDLAQGRPAGRTATAGVCRMER